MSLSAHDMETLRAAIGDALTFDDLDLIVQKCFGTARIHDVASRFLAQRLVAQSCLKLVEEEGMMSVFLGFVLASKQCTPALRAALVGVVPELKSVGESFASIVDSASISLADNAQQIANGVGDKAAIQTLADAIAEIKCYKALHEAIHQIKLDDHPEVPDDDSASELQQFRRELRKYLTILRTSYIKANSALEELHSQSAVRDRERTWVSALDERVLKIQGAIDRNEFGEVGLELDIARRNIDPLLGQINEHIYRIAKNLPLERVLLAFADQPGSAAMVALRIALQSRVVEHSRWQEADNALYSLHQAFAMPVERAFKKFARQWPAARKQIQVLASTGSDTWSDLFQAMASAIDDALLDLEKSMGEAGTGLSDNRFESSMFDPYDALRIEAQTRFFGVDNALRMNCVELLRLQTPLNAISARMS